MDLFTVFLAISLSYARFVSSGSPPVISEHPLDLLVAKGDPATLRCETTGESVEITWYKDSEQVKVGNGHRLLLPNGSLFLLKVNNGGTDSDAGTYHCVARNDYGEVRSQDANVRVAMLKDDFRINPHAVQALIDTRVTLECSPPKGFPEPIVTWRKDEKELNLNEDEKYHQSPDGSLVIENAQKSDAGFYQCVAINIVGERISKPARLSVYEKPQFLVEPKNVVADVNSSVLFECRVIGEPVPSISWKKVDGQMPIGRAYVARDRGGLRIERVQTDDAGEYVCYAKNPVGSIESTAELHVNSPPIFTKLPQNTRLNVGKTAIFECEAVGQPIPGIFWSKEGDQLFTFFSGLVSSDGRIQVSKDGRLIIDSVRQLDQGNYVCAAVNSAGSTLAKASLEIIKNATSSYPPPVIQYGHQNQTLMLNDHAILPCQGTGRKPIKIKWLKDSQEIDVNANQYKGRYRQLAVGTLQISELKREDTGVYTCIARNEDGEATWTASLVVEEHTNQNTVFQRMPDAAALPSPPGQPIVSNITEDSIELEWSVPERQGASQILGYLIQYWTPDERESWQNIHDVIPNNRFRVKNLLPGQSYFFLVRAENSKGIGLPSATSEMATTKFSNGKREDHRMGRMLDVESARQRLSSEQLIKLLEVRALNATAMLLSWKRQRKEPLIEGYYIKWRGPPLAQDHSWVNVTDPDVDHVIINGLRPFNNYEFFVIPYHQQVQGMPSNSLDGITAEAAPTMQPSDVRLRMLNISSLRVSWRPPPADHINGILKGFLINIRSNHSSVEDRNITTNERATSVTLYRLIPNASYAIKVAARTSAGVGVFYIGEPVIMNEETLRHHIRIFERSNNDWYKQPWAVLGFGIVLWCFLLLFVVLLWYRCCHHNRAENKEKKEREFIKIRDGSVPNNTMFGEARNAFWTDQNGGTVETFSGTIARPGQHMDHHIDYSTEYGTNCCNRDMVGGSGLVPHNQCRLHCSQTLQEINGDCAQHSPSQHYHYAQLPQEYFGSNEHGPVSTFKRRPPQYYDDPSPYATTTLVNPAGISSVQVVHAHQEPRLPSILSNPPKQPPSHFLSSRAVIRNSGTNNSRFDQQNSNSCSALVEISPECITAMTLQQSKNKNRAQQQQQQFCTTGRSTRNKGTKNGRSSSVTATNSRQITNANGCYQQQESSPSTDITSDGSSMNRRNGHSLTLMAEAPEYDPVMTESIHQQIVSIRKRKGRERSGRPNARNRVSLIEDEERAEQDPLMRRNASGREKEADLEADGEMSDEYISSGREAVTQEHCLSPVPYRPGQPMMGVNVSTLSGDTFMSGRLTKTTTPNN